MWGVTIVFLGLSNSQLQLFFIYFVSSICYHRKKEKRIKMSLIQQQNIANFLACALVLHVFMISSSQFQVRKEKLGDRITALHQLVSPFGKVIKLS